MIAEKLHALFKAHHVCHPEQDFRGTRSLHHFPRLLRIHRHRLLAEHRLAMPDGLQHVVVMQSIRAGYEHRIHFRTGAQFGGGGEGVFDSKLPRGLLCPSADPAATMP